MSLVGGTATITVSRNTVAGVVTWSAAYGGSGLAVALAQGRFAPILAGFPPYTLTGGPTDTATLQAIDAALAGAAAATAGQASADGPAIVNYLVANSIVSTTISVGGLQRTPTPNNPGVATVAPASPFTLQGTLT